MKPSFSSIKIEYIPCCPAYVDVFKEMLRNPRAILNYRLYLYSRMLEVVSNEENKRLWEWIRRCK